MEGRSRFVSDHNERIISEFSGKAELYAQAEELNDVGALTLLSEQVRLDAGDVVLDVACGPGVVSCHLAKTARSVVGIDLTEAMLEQARIHEKRQGLDNVTWIRGDVADLPFPAGTFSLVVSRYAFHHILEPSRVLHEMRRVCSATGRIAVVDVALPDKPTLADRFNAAEQLRDPSHVRALSVSGHRDLLAEAGLTAVSVAAYRIEFELEHLLEFSSASEQEKSRFRELLTEDSGLFLRARGQEEIVSYPISVFVASR